MNLMNAVALILPPERARRWVNPVPGRLADIDGFLKYTADCLDLINATPTGNQLLTGLSRSAFPVNICPTAEGNQAQAIPSELAMDTLTAAVNEYRRSRNASAAKPFIDAAVQAQYAHIPEDFEKYNQLAAEMNVAPLYSLFEPEDNWQPEYLAMNFRFRRNFVFRQAQLAGNDLMNLGTASGKDPLNLALATMSIDPRPDGVVLRYFFLLAICVALYPSAQWGPGTTTGVNFNVRNDRDNLRTSPDFRPPAIGLAHELMHARHYTRGSSPGFDNGHWSTTAVELLAVGIGPFAAFDAVNENAIRDEWAGLAGPIDPSNTWARPARRLVYEPPPPNTTVPSLRLGFHCT